MHIEASSEIYKNVVTGKSTWKIVEKDPQVYKMYNKKA